jgi:hypothetical protein
MPLYELYSWKKRSRNRYELQFGRDMPQADVLRSTSEYETEAFLFCVLTLDPLSSFPKQSRQDVRNNASSGTYNTIVQLPIKIVKARLKDLYFLHFYICSLSERFLYLHLHRGLGLAPLKCLLDKSL